MTKVFGTNRVVDNVNLEINSDEIVFLLGENGAGKTTTINMITGIFRPSFGDVLSKFVA